MSPTVTPSEPIPFKQNGLNQEGCQVADRDIDHKDYPEPHQAETQRLHCRNPYGTGDH